MFQRLSIKALNFSLKLHEKSIYSLNCCQNRWKRGAAASVYVALYSLFKKPFGARLGWLLSMFVMAPPSSGGHSHAHGHSVGSVLSRRSVLASDPGWSGGKSQHASPVVFCPSPTAFFFQRLLHCVNTSLPKRCCELDRGAQKDVIRLSAGCRSISEAETISAPQRSLFICFFNFIILAGWRCD